MMRVKQGDKPRSRDEEEPGRHRTKQGKAHTHTSNICDANGRKSSFSAREIDCQATRNNAMFRTRDDNVTDQDTRQICQYLSKKATKMLAIIYWNNRLSCIQKSNRYFNSFIHQFAMHIHGRQKRLRISQAHNIISIFFSSKVSVFKVRNKLKMPFYIALI